MRLGLQIFILLITTISFGQTNATLSGTVKDFTKGEEVIGATIRVKDQRLGAVTNEYGFYSLTLPVGKYTIQISSVGFLLIEKEIDLTTSQTLDFQLKTDADEKELDEVVISKDRPDGNVRDPLMGVERIDPKEISKIPVIFGEKDIIKTMQLIPGVKNAGEGSSGFYVRGGGADQNLILLDEAPVYNASHLLGFFSTFNSDAIKDAMLYKGNQPSNYGGRLSSVLDIKMNDGNQKRFNVGGGIGLISSKLMIEGPIVKDKASFLISGRRTYADLFLKLSDKFKDNKLFFYDLNAKLNYRLGKKDRLFVSGYFGRDKLGLGDVFGINWGNATGTLRWNHIINQKWFSNTSFIYSKYDYKISISGGDVKFDITSQIQDFNVKQEFQWFPNNRNKVKIGLNVINHGITPGQIDANEGSGINVKRIQPTNSIENAVYISNDYTITENLTMSYGLRGSNLIALANGDDMYTYNPDGTVATTTDYTKNKLLKSYFNVEPRLSLSWQYLKGQSIKAAYARNTQNIHQVSNSTSGSPTDVWLSSSLNIKPEISDQVALGWFKNFLDNKLELSTEVYYKSLQNQLDFKNGANEQANERLEGELLSGIGRAYGLEIMLKKKSGKFTGWIGYTLSRTERKINGINDGNWYVAKQDRTHDLSVVGIYEITPKWSVSALFVFYTGNAVTFPSGKYQIDGQTYFIYTQRNGYRMPNYHRLDLGVTCLLKNTKKFESSLNISIYNAYARENAYSITFRENVDDPSKTEAVQTTLFRIIPAITYNFKFK
ncbi:TonB-dependent receptor [Fluviicola taffensis]|uniref:TonB-dependent receptor plug n=1 Tax=Fluviicola taffensis (strain DSM 16823 / NCIMB 13979 / RW262) TaxID=755732 RepID=F2I9D1_FLUTR|nr:TonB-dependent receptor [Fluviicola taffensis]AEA44088.1 TonB-dependent receptor plug [Fluviicola taffensis DSM 16823]